MDRELAYDCLLFALIMTACFAITILLLKCDIDIL